MKWNAVCPTLTLDEQSQAAWPSLRNATHTFIHEWYEPSCIHFVSIHQMASPEQGGAHLDQLTTYLSTPKKRLNWHSWLTYSGRFTHISGHPSATWSSVEERKFAGQRLCIILSSYAEYLTIEYLISLRCCIVGTVRYTLIWQNEVYCAHFTTICWNTSEGSLFSSPTCTKCRRCR